MAADIQAAIFGKRTVSSLLLIVFTSFAWIDLAVG